MLNVKTRHFGEINIDSSKIITFSEGLPGFPDLKRFTLIADPAELEEGTAIFYWLQSVDDTEVAFCLVDPEKLMPGYDPLVDEAELENLGTYKPGELLIYNMAVLPEDLKEMTVNLKAPIIINMELKLGKQAICQNDGYSHKHYLFR